MALVLASLLKWKEDFFVPCPQISELNLHTSLYDVYMPAVEHIVDVAVAYGGVAVAQTCYHIFIYIIVESTRGIVGYTVSVRKKPT